MTSNWQLNPDAIDPADRDSFESMELLLQGPSTRVTSDARSGVSLLALRQNYYVKVFSGTGNRLQYLLGIGRYQRELANLHYFASVGLATPTVAAYGHRTLLGVLQQAALVTREVPASTTLKQLFEEAKFYKHGVAGARRILDELAQATHTLHARGFYHGDLKARNILVRHEAGGPKLFFFDCPRGHHPPRWRLRHCIVRELAHLHHDLERGGVRKVDMLYLFKRYRGCDKLGEQDKALALEALAYYSRRSMTRKRRRRIASKQNAVGRT